MASLRIDSLEFRFSLIRSTDVVNGPDQNVYLSLCWILQHERLFILNPLLCIKCVTIYLSVYNVVVLYFYNEINSSFAIILMRKRELVALLNLSSWCLVIAV